MRILETSTVTVVVAAFLVYVAFLRPYRKDIEYKSTVYVYMPGPILATSPIPKVAWDIPSVLVLSVKVMAERSKDNKACPGYTLLQDASLVGNVPDCLQQPTTSVLGVCVGNGTLRLGCPTVRPAMYLSDVTTFQDCLHDQNFAFGADGGTSIAVSATKEWTYGDGLLHINLTSPSYLPVVYVSLDARQFSGTPYAEPSIELLSVDAQDVYWSPYEPMPSWTTRHTPDTPAVNLQWYIATATDGAPISRYDRLVFNITNASAARVSVYTATRPEWLQFNKADIICGSIPVIPMIAWTRPSATLLPSRVTPCGRQCMYFIDTVRRDTGTVVQTYETTRLDSTPLDTIDSIKASGTLVHAGLNCSTDGFAYNAIVQQSATVSRVLYSSLFNTYASVLAYYTSMFQVNSTPFLRVYVRATPKMRVDIVADAGGSVLHTTDMEYNTVGYSNAVEWYITTVGLTSGMSIRIARAPLNDETIDTTRVDVCMYTQTHGCAMYFRNQAAKTISLASFQATPVYLAGDVNTVFSGPSTLPSTPIYITTQFLPRCQAQQPIQTTTQPTTQQDVSPVCCPQPSPPPAEPTILYACNVDIVTKECHSDCMYQRAVTMDNITQEVDVITENIIACMYTLLDHPFPKRFARLYEEMSFIAIFDSQDATTTGRNNSIKVSYMDVTSREIHYTRHMAARMLTSFDCDHSGQALYLVIKSDRVAAPLPTGFCPDVTSILLYTVMMRNVTVGTGGCAPTVKLREQRQTKQSMFQIWAVRSCDVTAEQIWPMSFCTYDRSTGRCVSSTLFTLYSNGYATNPYDMSDFTYPTLLLSAMSLLATQIDKKIISSLEYLAFNPLRDTPMCVVPAAADYFVSTCTPDISAYKVYSAGYANEDSVPEMQGILAHMFIYDRSSQLYDPPQKCCMNDTGNVYRQVLRGAYSKDFVEDGNWICNRIYTPDAYAGKLANNDSYGSVCIPFDRQTAYPANNDTGRTITTLLGLQVAWHALLPRWHCRSDMLLGGGEFEEAFKVRLSSYPSITEATIFGANKSVFYASPNVFWRFSSRTTSDQRGYIPAYSGNGFVELGASAVLKTAPIFVSPNGDRDIVISFRIAGAFSCVTSSADTVKTVYLTIRAYDSHTVTPILRQTYQVDVGWNNSKPITSATNMQWQSYSANPLLRQGYYTQAYQWSGSPGAVIRAILETPAEQTCGVFIDRLRICDLAASIPASEYTDTIVPGEIPLNPTTTQSTTTTTTTAITTTTATTTQVTSTASTTTQMTQPSVDCLPDWNGTIPMYADHCIGAATHKVVALETSVGWRVELTETRVTPGFTATLSSANRSLAVECNSDTEDTCSVLFCGIAAVRIPSSTQSNVSTWVYTGLSDTVQLTSGVSSSARSSLVVNAYTIAIGSDNIAALLGAEQPLWLTLRLPFTAYTWAIIHFEATGYPGYAAVVQLNNIRLCGSVPRLQTAGTCIIGVSGKCTGSVVLMLTGDPQQLHCLSGVSYGYDQTERQTNITVTTIELSEIRPDISPKIPAVFVFAGIVSTTRVVSQEDTCRSVDVSISRTGNATTSTNVYGPYPAIATVVVSYIPADRTTPRTTVRLRDNTDFTRVETRIYANPHIVTTSNTNNTVTVRVTSCRDDDTIMSSVLFIVTTLPVFSHTDPAFETPLMYLDTYGFLS
jgi:hypothetical protein